MPSEGIKIVSENRKAFHDYFIDDRVEAGIILTGTEIKSIRNGKVNLKDSYARINNGEVWVYQMHISPYEQGNRFNHEPLRPRKLPVSYTHLRAHETDSYLVCRLLLE